MEKHIPHSRKRTLQDIVELASGAGFSGQSPINGSPGSNTATVANATNADLLFCVILAPQPGEWLPKPYRAFAIAISLTKTDRPGPNSGSAPP